MSIESLRLSNHLILCHPFSSRPQSFPASRSFLMSRLFASGGQSTGASVSALVLPVNIQGWFPFSSVQFSLSVMSDCDPMDCSTTGFPVLHYLLEFAQTHVHWVDDAIQPSHLLSPASSPALYFPSIRVFSNESALHIRLPKYWSFSFSISPTNEYSGLISFRIDWFDLLAVQGILKSLL